MTEEEFINTRNAGLELRRKMDERIAAVLVESGIFEDISVKEDTQTCNCFILCICGKKKQVEKKRTGQGEKMTNELGQPTREEVAHQFCTEMLCNALLCDGCPVSEMFEKIELIEKDWQCANCGFTNHGEWRKCGNCDIRKVQAQ